MQVMGAPWCTHMYKTNASYAPLSTHKCKTNASYGCTIDVLISIKQMQVMGTSLMYS